MKTKKINAIVGKQFTVKMTEIGTAGYTWVHTGLDVSVLQIISKDRVFPDNNIGSAAILKYKFLPVKEGNQSITFKLKRPWNDEIEKEIKLDIIIKKGE